MENHPTDDQRARLQDFLIEVMHASRRYGMLIATAKNDEPPVVIDVERGTIVGIDFEYITDEENDNLVKSYWCESSILDGVWIVEADDGSLVEQRYWKA